MPRDPRLVYAQHMSDVEFSTAEEFIKELTDKKYRVAQLRWLFRGVKDASYPLLPVSHRSGEHCPFDPAPATVWEQVSREHQALLRFNEAAHREGLQIPNWHNTTGWLRSAKAILNDRQSGIEWLNPVAEAFVAIAQHYGTPTRLLDWTRDPLVAAYFAASSLENSQRADNYIAVWILDTDIEVPNSSGLKTPLRESWETRIVEIPYDVNQNARAQRGVFIDYLRDHASPWDKGGESHVAQPFERHLESLSAKSALQKLTLPGSQAAALMRELHDWRIDGASLFPGYAGAARAERERRWWDS